MKNQVQSPLVSVVMPCYNGRRWVGEALESCFAQTYPCVEVIVIDDGSTDGSVELLQQYGDRIRLQLGPNRGACHARNRGVELARGKYVQFLDSDDLLLPEKIEHQVSFLETQSEFDVVYGDWRHRNHLADGQVRDGGTVYSGSHNDVLEALLGGWWVAVHAILYSRASVLHSAGWDETLPASQDSDFFRSVILAGGHAAYQSGCYALYRRHDGGSISTTNKRQWLDSGFRSLHKSEATLAKQGMLTDAYRRALAKSYHYLARNYYPLDVGEYRRVISHILTLCPDFQPEGSRFYRLANRFLGLERAEELASNVRQLRPSRTGPHSQ